MEGGKIGKFFCFCGIIIVLLGIIGLIVGLVIVFRPKSLSLNDEKTDHLR